MTVTDAERLANEAVEAEGTLEMDEDAFRAFYDRTARILWAYLARMTGEPHVADDLLQEAYYRFIRSGARLDGEAHRRHYLFRIATNLARDRHRRGRGPEEPLDSEAVSPAPAPDEVAGRTERRQHLLAALGRLKSRERAMLWLAYAEGSSHEEVAEILGLKAGSVRVLLFRARHRLAELLRGAAGIHEGVRHGGR